MLTKSRSESPPPTQSLRNAPLPPRDIDVPTFLRALLKLFVSLTLIYLVFGHLQNSWRPKIHVSSDGATWEAANWSGYDVKSPLSENIVTRVTISLTRVTAQLIGKDLSLSFLLVQQWNDPRLVVRDWENGECEIFI